MEATNKSEGATMTTQTNKFFLFECRYGDDNDQRVGDLVVEALTKEAAFDVIEAKLKSRLPEDTMIDGDDLCLNAMWWEYPEEHNEECVDCDHGTPYHEDYAFESEHETEEQADEARARYHSNLGTFYALPSQ